MVAKRVRSLLVGTLAATMVFTLVPQPAMAAQGQTKIHNAIGENSVKKQKKTKDYVEGQAIVYYYDSLYKMKSSSSNPFGDDIQIEKSFSLGKEKNSKVKSSNSQSLSQVKVAQVKSKKYSTKQIIQMCKKNSNVKYVEPNYIIHKLDATDDAYTKSQWAIQNDTEGNENKDINPETEWENADKNTSERVIALVDTGMDYEHEDLSEAAWENDKKVTGLQGEHGYDFINEDDDPMDDNGHGTHCAGIMCGKKDNQKGIAGVDDGAKIMALKVLDDYGSGYYYETLEAYYYIYLAQKKGVPVVAVNNSWGGISDEEAVILNEMVTKVGEAGALSCFAAGNSGMNVDERPEDPSCMDNKYIISVGASSYNDKPADFSNYGASNVDVFAPGASILSSVSYDCFNPSAYSETMRSQECDYFTNSPNSSTPLQVWKGDRVLGTEDTESGFQINSANKNCLKFDLQYDDDDLEAFDNGDYVYELLYPVEGTSKSQYLSFMEKLELQDFEDSEDGSEDDYYANHKKKSVENSWYHATLRLGDCEIVNRDGKHYYFIEPLDFNPPYGASYYIDDVSISKKGQSLSSFGKYDFYNGTSMATPYVTGAVSLLSASRKSDSVLQRKGRIISACRVSDDMEGCCQSGGVLDLSKCENIKPSICSVKLTANGLLIEGTSFGNSKGTLKINDNAINSSDITWNDESILVANQSLTNKQADIGIETADGQKASFKTFLTYLEKKIQNEGTLDGKVNSSVMTDGKQLYMLTDGNASFGTLTQNENGKYQLNRLESLDYTKIFNDIPGLIMYDDRCQVSTDFVYDNGNFYGIAMCDMKAYRRQALVCYNVKDDTWTKVCELQGDLNNEYGITLGDVNGELYIVGGMDENGVANNKVYQFNKTTKQFEENTSISLPEGRALGKLTSMGSKMVYSLGVDVNEEFPCNLIFDGTKWSKSKINESQYGCYQKDSFYRNGMIPVDYYSAITGLCSQGIMFAGLERDELGDVYIYNVDKDTYEKTGYSINAQRLNLTNLCGNSVGNKFFLFSSEIEYDDDFMFKSGSDYDYEDEDSDSGTDVYSMSIDSAYADVALNVDQSAGNITQSGPFIVGQDVTLNFTASQGKRFVAYKDAHGNVLSTQNPFKYHVTKDTSIYVETADYVSSMNFASKSISLATGQMKQLIPEILPANASGVKLEWSSSNAKYATVSSTGLVTALQEGVGKTVTITATALDGSKKSASIEVSIVPNAIVASSISLSPVKSKTAYVGTGKKLTVVFNPTNVTETDLIWSSSNKKYATVDRNGVVSVKKAGVGKNVTITVKYKSNTKLTASVKLKIKDIKLKSLKMNVKKASLKVGKKIQLSVKFNPTNASYKNVKWKSSKSKYASVSSKGIVTAKKKGKGKKVTIYAYGSNGKKVTCKIKIK